jgi:hypothetical protein
MSLGKELEGSCMTKTQLCAKLHSSSLSLSLDPKQQTLAEQPDAKRFFDQNPQCSLKARLPAASSSRTSYVVIPEGL